MIPGKTWFEQPWVIIAFLVFVFPVGLVLMWRYATWPNVAKWAVSGVVGVLFALFVVAGAVGGEDNESSDETTDTPEATAARDATNTPRPTRTAEETDIPEATETPKPTATPKPTNTLGPPELTTEECTYILAVIPLTEDAGTALTDLSDLLAEPDFFSTEWTVRVATQLAILQVSDQRASALAAPPSLQGVHAEFAGAMSNLGDASDLLAEGLDTFDADLIDQAANRILTAQQQLFAATDAIADFRQSRSGTC